MVDGGESAAACVADRDEGSITQWISALKAGDPDAAPAPGTAFEKARENGGRPAPGCAPGSSAVESEESAAPCAFESVCNGAKLGRFPRLSDREDLWQILVMVTVEGRRRDPATHGWQAGRRPGSLAGHPGEG